MYVFGEVLRPIIISEHKTSKVKRENSNSLAYKRIKTHITVFMWSSDWQRQMPSTYGYMKYYSLHRHTKVPCQTLTERAEYMHRPTGTVPLVENRWKTGRQLRHLARELGNRRALESTALGALPFGSVPEYIITGVIRKIEGGS